MAANPVTEETSEEQGEDVSIEDIKEVEETASEEDTGSTNT